MPNDEKPRYRFRGTEPPTEASRASILEPQVDDEGVAELFLYDPIDSWGGWWGVSAKEVAVALALLPEGTDQIRLYINSPGGEVWDAMAIVNQLRRHPARVVAVVDGIAASAASVIAVSADEVVMGMGAQMMIHDAWNVAVGNEADMLAMASRLKKDSDAVAAIYAGKAGGTAEEWRELMREETWLSAEEAVAAGLADRMSAEDAGEQSKAAVVDLSAFRYAGRAHAPTPHVPNGVRSGVTAHPEPVLTVPRRSAVTKSPVSSEPGYHNREEDPVGHTEFLNGLRSRLGVTNAQADEAMILAALDEALTERASDASADLADGVVAVDKTLLEQLQADAAAGRQALANQDAARRDGIVTDAMQGGKISPAMREKWRAALDRDEAGTVELLSGMPAIVPVEAKAVAGSLEDASSEDALYRQAFGATTKEA